MRAIVHRAYGPAELLELAEVPTPVPGPGEVLVRVRAAGTNPGDWHVMRGSPFMVRLALGGLFRPRSGRLGSDVAGRVEAVGEGVENLSPGDEVFGCVAEHGFGAFAEYVCAPEGDFVHKPDRVGFEEAAAVPSSAMTALQGLRDAGALESGQRVLVNGASGGVGTFAVQIAKSFGAEVTGVCSTRNLDMVRALGADHVIDYTVEDFTAGDARYDLILDTAAYGPVRARLRVLRPEGAYVMVGGDARRTSHVMTLGWWLALRTGRSVKFLISRPSRADLLALRAYLDAGRIIPVIDRRYSLAEVPGALRYLEDGHARGKVVVTV